MCITIGARVINDVLWACIILRLELQTNTIVHNSFFLMSNIFPMFKTVFISSEGIANRKNEVFSRTEGSFFDA